jgi:hypothetical protein
LEYEAIGLSDKVDQALLLTQLRSANAAAQQLTNNQTSITK